MLVSSHVLSEVAQTVDEVVIISGGRLVRQSTLAELVAQTDTAVRAVSPDAERLTKALETAGVQVSRDGDTALRAYGVPTSTVGRVALEAGVELHELAAESSDLEAVFFELTGKGSDR